MCVGGRAGGLRGTVAQPIYLPWLGLAEGRNPPPEARRGGRACVGPVEAKGSGSAGGPGDGRPEIEYIPSESVTVIAAAHRDRDRHVTACGLAAGHGAPSGADRQDRDKPCIQLEESVSGFRCKQTDSDTHRWITPRWRGRRPRAGLQHSVARDRPPAASCPKTPRTLAATPLSPRPAKPRTWPGSSSRVAG